MDECVVCRVRHGGHVVGYRNHAHRLARDVFSEHTDARGVALPLLGRMSAQRPQVIRLVWGRVSGSGSGWGYLAVVTLTLTLSLTLTLTLILTLTLTLTPTLTLTLTLSR